MFTIAIDYEKCIGYNCSECMDICPMEVFAYKDKKIILNDLLHCSRCEVCMDICPYDAITIKY
jgi:NAD-dependent dihydropyrimidine dehydrogenase PreA subunit